MRTRVDYCISFPLSDVSLLDDQLCLILEMESSSG